MHTSRRLGSNFLPGLPLAKAVTPREVTDRVHIFATSFAHVVENARTSPSEFALRNLEQRDYHIELEEPGANDPTEIPWCYKKL